MNQNLAQAFAAANAQSPCNGCEHQRKCAAESQACPDFFYFVNTPNPKGVEDTIRAQSGRIFSREKEAARLEHHRNTYAADIKRKHGERVALSAHVSACAQSLSRLYGDVAPDDEIETAEFVRDAAAKKWREFEDAFPAAVSLLTERLDSIIERLTALYLLIQTDEDNREAISRIGSDIPCIRKPNAENFAEIFKRDPECTAACGWDCGNMHCAE